MHPQARKQTCGSLLTILEHLVLRRRLRREHLEECLLIHAILHQFGFQLAQLVQIELDVDGCGAAAEASRKLQLDDVGRAFVFAQRLIMEVGWWRSEQTWWFAGAAFQP